MILYMSVSVIILFKDAKIVILACIPGTHYSIASLALLCLSPQALFHQTCAKRGKNNKVILLVDFFLNTALLARTSLVDTAAQAPYTFPAWLYWILSCASDCTSSPFSSNWNKVPIQVSTQIILDVFGVLLLNYTKIKRGDLTMITNF